MSSASDPSSTAKVHLLCLVLPGQTAELTALSARFTERNPDIVVEVQAVEQSSDGAARWVDSVASLVEKSDVFIAHEVDPIATQMEKYVLDLRPLLNTDDGFAPEDIFERVWSRFTTDTGLWGIPLEGRLQAVAYQKPLFAAAALEYPQVGWTWQSLEQIARTLTVRDDRVILTYGLVDSGGYILPLSVAGYGVNLEDTEGLRRELAQAQSPAANAIAHYAALIADGVLYDVRDVGAIPSLASVIAADQAALWTFTVGGATVGDAATIGLAPFPEGGGAHFQGIYISARTEHPMAAWRWVHYVSKNYAPTGDHRLPVRRSLAEERGYWARLGETATVVQEALAALSPRGISPASWSLLHNAYTAVSPYASESIASLPTPAAPIAAPTLAPPVIPHLELLQNADTTVTVRYCGLPQEWGETVRAFNAAQDGIRVTLARSQPNAQGGVGLAELAAACDCFNWAAEVPYAASAGLILNLQPFVEADADFDIADFFPPAIEEARWRGDLWALPFTITPIVLHYNKYLFDQAGIPYPDATWNWADFLHAAHQLTHIAENETVYGFIDLLRPDQTLLILITQRGGRLVDNPDHPARATLTSPEIIDAVQWYVALNRDYGVTPAGVTPAVNPQRTLQHYHIAGSGKAAMWLFPAWWHYDAPDLQRPGATIGVTPLPVATIPATLWYYTAYYISAQSPAPEGCWVWLRYLTRQFRPGDGAPAYLAALESYEYIQHVGRQVATTIMDSRAYAAAAKPWAASDMERCAFKHFEAALTAIDAGSAVDAALQQAQIAAEAACVTAP